MKELIKQLRLGASISRDRNINLDYAAIADRAADAIEMLITVEPMTQVADQFAHRMALELECVLSDGAYSNKWYSSAMQVLSEYRSAMNTIHEEHSPTFMGEPYVKHTPIIAGT